MTPTEQDKELQAEVKQILKDGFNYYVGERKDTSSDMKPLDIYCTEHIIQLITADRERVALEARIDTATDILYGLSGTYKHISRYEVRELVAELKAQQEEV